MIVIGSAQMGAERKDPWFNTEPSPLTESERQAGSDALDNVARILQESEDKVNVAASERELIRFSRSKGGIFSGVWVKPVDSEAALPHNFYTVRWGENRKVEFDHHTIDLPIENDRQLVEAFKSLFELCTNLDDIDYMMMQRGQIKIIPEILEKLINNE